MLGREAMAAYGGTSAATITPMEESKRSAFFGSRTISRDVVVPEYPELGLIAFASPNDPEPSIRVEDGRIVEIDGVAEADFDLIDAFLAAHGIDPAIAEEAMAIDDVAFARMLCGADVPRTDILRLVEGMTPAKVARVLSLQIGRAHV